MKKIIEDQFGGNSKESERGGHSSGGGKYGGSSSGGDGTGGAHAVKITCITCNNALEAIAEVNADINSIVGDIERVSSGLEIESPSTVHIKKNLTGIAKNLQKTGKTIRLLEKAGKECVQLYQRTDHEVASTQYK